MVIQRDKPITIWGWADAGDSVTVRFGAEQTETEAAGDDGRWEVSFAAKEASADPRKLVITSGEQTIEMDNLVIGDVWVMNGQSNMRFTMEEELAKQIEKWEKKVADKRAQGVAENKLPKKPTLDSIRSWNIPGMSPSDAASCYNGMFGAFKGLNIKGVLFHQGYNNAMSSNCRPKRYRVLMKLMVEGWRDDFNDAALPVGVIGFCAGAIPQSAEDFETWSVSGGAYIRESQRL